MGNKVSGKENHAQNFHALGQIMHSYHDDESIQEAITQIFDKFKNQKKILTYFYNTWVAKDKICK